MVTRDNVKYYTLLEVASMVGKYPAFFYYRAKKQGFPKPEKLDGVKYYNESTIEKIRAILGLEEAKEKELFNSREVAEMIGRSRQTVVNWCKHSNTLEKRGEARLIPAPDAIGMSGRRYWKKAKIEEIRRFSENIKRGDMAEFNRELWGKR